MVKSTRTVILSGQNQYVPLLPTELAAYRCEYYFTDLTTQSYQAVNLEWNPTRKFMGRVVFARNVYVVREVMINYNNQLLFTEESPTLYLEHHADCRHIESQRLLLDFIDQQANSGVKSVDPVALITAAVGAFSGAKVDAAVLAWLQGNQSTLGLLIDSTPYSAYTQRPAVGLEVDGIYYSMAGSASGQLAIQCWNFDDTCVFPVSGTVATPDNHGHSPASAGGPDLPGGPGTTPPATGTGVPPTPGDPAGIDASQGDGPAPPEKPVPGPTLPDGSQPQACVKYDVTILSPQVSGPTGTNTVSLPGNFAGPIKTYQPFPVGTYSWVLQYGVGCPGQEGTIFMGGGNDNQPPNPAKPSYIILGISK